MQRTYPEGVPSWVDTEQPDVEAAMAFYGAVLGWTFAPATPPGTPFRYVIAQLDGADVAGLGGPAEAPGAGDGVVGAEGAPTWNTYVAVEDADAAAARVADLGGTVTQPPTAAGEGGRSVVATDPSGAQVRLWEARNRLGAQVANAPGSWNFSELHTADRDAAVRFYGALFGWQLDDVGFATLVRRPGYGDHLAATTDPGIRERQAQGDAPLGFEDAVAWWLPLGPGERPRWSVTFAVADRDATADLVLRHGGTVLHTGDNAWTRTALVRDPQGAELTVSQFLG